MKYFFLLLFSSLVFAAPLLPDQSVTTSKIKDSAVTGTKVLDHTLTVQKVSVGSIGTSVGIGDFARSISSGNFSTTSTSFIQVTNLTVTLITAGRPVEVRLITNNVSSDSGYFGETSGNIASGLFKRDGSGISAYSAEIGSGSILVPASSLSTIDNAPAGSHTYTFEMSVSSGTGFCKECILFAREL